MTASVAAILVVGPAWVGDMVMAQSLFKLLKARHPAAAIDVLAPTWSKPLLARMPEVRHAVEMPLGHGQLQLGVRRRLGLSLRERHYDWAIVLPYTWKSALVPYWAQIPRCTGFRGEMRWGLLNDVRRLDQQALPMMVQRYLALGLAPGDALPDPLPTPTLRSAPPDAALARLDLERPARLLALCPGAEYGPAKRWPAASFAEVARHFLRRGDEVWVFGSERDAATGEEIVRLAPGCRNLAGRTRLEEAIDLLALATHVVSNDSGLMHVAAALGRDVIAVYGSSDPAYTPPLGKQTTIVSLNLSCSPCFKRECPYGHYRCLNDLSPAAVINAMERRSVA